MPQSRLSRRTFTTPTFTTFAFVVLLGAFAAPALALETWDGGGGDDNWSTADNWVSNTAPTNPVSDGELLFTGSLRPTPNADLAYTGITGITFDNAAAAFTVGGQRLTFDNGWVNNTGTETQTITNDLAASAASATLVANADAGNLVLSGAVDLTATTGANLIISGAANTTVSGIVSGAGGQVTKTGAGTATLSGANTYTGGTTLDAGTLAVGSDTALGTGTITLNAGTIQATGGDRVVNNNVVVGGDVAIASTGSSLTLGSAATTVNLGAATRTITTAGNLNIAGNVINTAGGLTKTGAGTLTLSGTNLYTGMTTVSAGTLALSGGQAILDTQAVVLEDVAGARLQLNSSETVGSISGGGSNGGDIELGSNTLTVGDASDQVYDGVVSGTGGAIVKQGSGTLTLNGTNTYTGGTTLNAGTLAVGNDAALGTGTVTLNAGTIQASGGDRVVNNSVVVGGDVAVGDTGNNLTLGSAATTVNLGAATRTITTTGDLNIAGSVISSGAGLTKAGTGTMTLSGANLYTGTTTVNAGILALSGGNAILDTAAVVLAIDPNANLEVMSDETIGSLAGGGNVLLDDANTLTIGGSETTTYSGIISGTGSLAKAGTGSQTLTGVNTYSGGTTLTSGTLGVGNDSALGTGTVTLNGGTIQASDADHTISNAVVVGGDFTVGNTGNTLNFANTVDLGTALRTITTAGDLTVDGVVSGTGGLAKQGAGTLTLNSANTYSGGTSLLAGTLAIGNNDALGAETLNITGGSLRAAGGDRVISNDISVLGSFAVADSPGNGLDLAGDVNLVATATITANNTAGFVVSGDISGTAGAGLTKAGTGTMTLSGANTYSGDTTISAGTLQLQGGEAIRDDGKIVLSNAATAKLELLDDETVGAIAGEGTSGDILLGANRLTFGTAASTIFGGDITGTGGLTYVGTGTLTVTSDLAFTGDLIVRSGTFNSTSSIASAVIVEDTGRLHALATGDLTVESGGTVNPGGSAIETLDVAGNLTVQNGGILEINVDPTLGTTNDDVKPTGNATFDDGSKITFVVANPTSLEEGDSQDFLDAVGVVSIDPNAVVVTDNVTNLNAQVRVDDTGHILSVLWTVEGVLQDRARGENNRRIARAIEELEPDPEDQAAIDARQAILDIADADQLNAALDQRSPASYFSAVTSNIMTAQTVNATVSHELRMAPLAARLAAADITPETPGAAMFAAAANDPYVLGAAIEQQRRRNNDNFLSLEELSEIEPYRPQDMTSFFASPFKVSQDRDTEADFVGYDSDTFGIAMGVRHPIREDVAVGLLFAYDRTNVNFKNDRGGSDIDTLRFGPLASYRPVDKIWFLDAAATYGFHMFDTRREITVPEAVTTEADYNAHDGTIYIDGGADFEFRGWLLTPMASLQYMHLFQESFSESGGGPVADLDVDSQSFDSLISRIGMTVSYPMDYASMVFVPEVALGWQHEYLADDQDVTANFAGGGSAFSIQTGIPNRDGVFYSGGLSVLLDDTKSLYFRYDGLADGNGEVTALSGGFVLRF